MALRRRYSSTSDVKFGRRLLTRLSKSGTPELKPRKKHFINDGEPVYPQPYNPYATPLPQDLGPPPNMASYSDIGVAPPPYGPPGDFNVNRGYNPAGQGFTIPGQLLSEPMVANVAMQYGQALMGSGKQLVDREIEKYVPVSRLKYYFAVDTAYVVKKLSLLLFPFTHTDWSMKFEQEEPVQPRYEINAPDLYIPTMAYLTYVVVAGLVLGTQNRFSPEVIGIHASSALAWLFLEIFVEVITLYVTSIQTKLKTLDLIAYGGYKYVGIILCMLLSLLFHRVGYYIGLIYFGLSLAFFLVRTLKLQVLPEDNSNNDTYRSSASGNKRRIYFLLFMAGIQPLLMWWLSAHLIATSPPQNL